MVISAVHDDRDPSLEQDRDWLAGVTACRYEVIREIAQGGMSRVLLGWDRSLGREVALKVLGDVPASTVEGRERFRREALITAAADHPNIVPCYDFICDGSRAVAVMRLVRGDSLEDRLTGTPLEAEQLLRVLVPIANALAHMHQRGIVHRDVKPANILLEEGDDWPFLIDFGVAILRTSDHSRWEATQRLGTPDFMSPEQALGAWDADHRSDIYSLGLVMYAGLAGSLPFRGSPLALAAQRTAFDVPPLRQAAPQVPRALAEVVDRCLARDPGRRWRDATALGKALSRAA